MNIYIVHECAHTYIDKNWEMNITVAQLANKENNMETHRYVPYTNTTICNGNMDNNQKWNRTHTNNIWQYHKENPKDTNINT